MNYPTFYRKNDVDISCLLITINARRGQTDRHTDIQHDASSIRLHYRRAPKIQDYHHYASHLHITTNFAYGSMLLPTMQCPEPNCGGFQSIHPFQMAKMTIPVTGEIVHTPENFRLHMSHCHFAGSRINVRDQTALVWVTFISFSWLIPIKGENGPRFCSLQL